MGFLGCTGKKLEKRRKKLEYWLRNALQHQHSRAWMRPMLRAFLGVDQMRAPSAAPTSAAQMLSAATPAESPTVPDLRKDPEGWFRYFDKNGNGLEQHEVIKALLMTFPGSDPYTVREFVTSLWSEFDLDGSGTISIAEFLQRHGLRKAILAQMKLAPAEKPAAPVSGAQAQAPSAVLPVTSSQAPDLRQDPEGWFRHFDKNGNGLEQHEVIKALLATCPESDPYTVREFVTSLWGEFDLDGSGCVSLAEFLRRRGLREAILTQMKLAPSEISSHPQASKASDADANSLVTLQVEIPAGVQEGQSLQITVPDGRQALVTVPKGYAAGMVLQFEFNP